MRTLLYVVTGIVLVSLLIVGFLLKVLPYVLIGILATTMGIIGNAVVLIAANPPRVALETFLGRFTGKVKRAGYQLFIGRPFLWGYIEIITTTINYDFAEQIVTLPDNASVKIRGSITFAPAKDEKGPDKKSLLIQYVENGEKDGVTKILEDSFGSRVREYFQSPDEGPKDWVEARASSDEGILAVLRSLVGDTYLGLTPQDAEVLKDFERYSGIGLPDVFRAYLRHGDPASWAELERAMARLSTEEESNLTQALESLSVIIRGVRNGLRRTVVPGLGVVITRLNFDEISAMGGVAEAASKRAVERLEGEAEQYELTVVTARIRELTAEYITMGIPPEVAVRMATELVQSERGKVPISITKQVNAIDPTTLRVAGEAAAEILHEMRK